MKLLIGAVCAVSVVAAVLVSRPAADAFASWADLQDLDEYAAELGLVMARARGAEPEVYARAVDGPGPDVQTLAVDVDDGVAQVVLRLRQERQDCGWLAGSSCDRYEVSACYRWVFDDTMDEHEPTRLDSCPPGPVIELGPAPVEPHLPDGLVEHLQDNLTPPRAVSEQALLTAVRATYTEAVRAARQSPNVERNHLLGLDEALPPRSAASAASAGDSVAVAVGRGDECVMVRVTRGEVEVWVPDRISLMPGEVGCDAAGQLARRAAD